MSSLTRRIQRAAKRDNKTLVGSKLGYSNPKAKDLLARLEREKRRG